MHTGPFGIIETVLTNMGNYRRDQWDHSDVVMLLSAPNQTTTISGKGQNLANVLASICSNSRVACGFVPGTTPAVAGWTDWQAPRVINGANMSNPTGVAQKQTIKWTISESMKTSFEASLKFNLSVVPMLSDLTAKIGKEYSNSAGVERTVDITIEPNKLLVLRVKYPVWTVTGDLTIEIGTTTIKITDVTIQVPDTGTDPLRQPTLDPQQIPL
jgi:hypothetical protein